jgi:multiple sugar transport system ATP-binding protein
MAEILMEELTKVFGKTIAVDHVTIKAEDKELVILVGPSGCGKSTTLRMIAGLEEATEGRIYIGDRLVNNLAPKDRNVAMVFQNYALYPYFDVYKNMAFGLKLRKYKKEEIDERVKNAAKILEISNLLDRKPAQLSGGQRQRVAMGRAIVRDPDVFLFDEPLSNLDAKLRVQMRAEIKKLHNRLQKTIVYVTHDQVEAMTLGDRIVVMNHGEVMQDGPPMEIYNFPANVFVAGFIGSPAMNFVPAKLIERQSKLLVDIGPVQLEIPSNYEKYYKQYKERDVTFGFRPEHLQDHHFAEDLERDKWSFEGEVTVVEPMGSEILIYAKMVGQEIIAKVGPKSEKTISDKMMFTVDMNNMHLFDMQTGDVIDRRKGHL